MYSEVLEPIHRYSRLGERDTAFLLASSNEEVNVHVLERPGRGVYLYR